MKTEPLVSIICLSYNHENYIRECLESLVNQKTDFVYEIIVHDDASLDNSQGIIKEYESNYPDLFKNIYQVENQYSKGPGRVSNIVYQEVSGKYVAFCEGDDYWIDMYKLQKQVDILENDSNVIFSNTNCDIFYQKENVFERRINDINRKSNNFDNVKSTVTVEDILNHRYIVRTATVMLRNEYLRKYFSSEIYSEMQGKVLMGDTPMWAYMVSMPNKKVHYLDISTSVYRRSDNTASNMVVIDKALRFELSCKEMILFFISNKEFQLSNKFKKETIDVYNSLVLRYFLFNSEYKTLFEKYLSSKTKKQLKDLKKDAIIVYIKRTILTVKFRIKNFKEKVFFFLRNK
ncbi:Glycosyl transferase family 2 [Myroides marinus]|uniref:Glycosyl transferase family 2 n=1 Tax=Myroides marinus TaxID=703342 RepID=A0A1H6XX17_9FLAO|nr:glycosyltransferase [Myroides marinus]SEJ29125.1 Glycosyl transferase family 2 [Myroides marinus]